MVNYRLKRGTQRYIAPELMIHGITTMVSIFGLLDVQFGDDNWTSSLEGVWC